MTLFSVDERLSTDTFWVGEGPLSRVLLMNDVRFPWLVLVPRRMGLTDWVDLGAGEVVLLDGEIRAATAGLRAISPFDKLNVASLGNMVRQLHVHVVARQMSDAAWPDPVWGVGQSVPYAAGLRDMHLVILRREMGLLA